MTKIRQKVPAKRKHHGFSLIEVLIALIILSVGMLGIASLYVQSMQAGRTSLFRHHAITLAGDVADRIRANPTAKDTYETGTATNHNCIDQGTNCTANQMAEQDLLAWQNQAAETLPGGASLTVAVDTTVVPILYTITITWPEPGIGPNDPQPTYSISVPVLEF